MGFSRRLGRWELAGDSWSFLWHSVWAAPEASGPDRRRWGFGPRTWNLSAQQRVVVFVDVKMSYLNLLKVPYLVGGLEHEFYDFPFSWEFHHPNWRTHSIIFQRGRAQLPTRLHEVLVLMETSSIDRELSWIVHCHGWLSKGIVDIEVLLTVKPIEKGIMTSHYHYSLLQYQQLLH